MWSLWSQIKQGRSLWKSARHRTQWISLLRGMGEAPSCEGGVEGGGPWREGASVA